VSSNRDGGISVTPNPEKRFAFVRYSKIKDDRIHRNFQKAQKLHIPIDPNRKETLDVSEKNVRIMCHVGFALVPLAWLMCWVYSSRRRKESEALDRLARRSFILWWVFVLGT
jgi:hypothetical protein